MATKSSRTRYHRKYGLPLAGRGAKRSAIEESRQEDVVATRTDVSGERVGCWEEDDTAASTPSLTTVDEEMDEDEEDPALVDCMGLLTDEILEGFDRYVDSLRNPGSVAPLVTGEGGSEDPPASWGPTTTPRPPAWSVRSWWRGRSSSHGTSVHGVEGKHGFEPDVYTLDGLRRDLFGEMMGCEVVRECC